jgi:hypothetical protein
LLQTLAAEGEEYSGGVSTAVFRMISLFLFAHGQIVFLVWVTLGERKWSILAERRSVLSTPRKDDLDAIRTASCRLRRAARFRRVG